MWTGKYYVERWCFGWEKSLGLMSHKFPPIRIKCNFDSVDEIVEWTGQESWRNIDVVKKHVLLGKLKKFFLNNIKILTCG